VTATDLFTPILDLRPGDEAWRPMTWPPTRDTRLRGRTVELARVDPDTDAAALHAALDHDAVWEHTRGRPGDPVGYARAFAEALADGRLPWVVRLARSYAGLGEGTVVGASSYLEVSVPDARLEIGSTAYDPRVWGSLVNPETKLLLLEHAFDVLGAGRVQLKTDIRNVRSQRAIARLGARYEGTLRRYQRRADGTLRDTVLFSVLADDWPAVRDRISNRLIDQSR